MTLTLNASDYLARLQSTKTANKYDFLKVGTNDVLIKYINNGQNMSVEAVLFSDSVLKINRRRKQQQRDLVITNEAIYHFRPKKYSEAQRVILNKQLSGITINTTQDGETLLQVRDDYDYRLIIVRQADVIKLLTQLYENLIGKPLPVTINDDIDKIQVFKSDVEKRRMTTALSTFNNYQRNDSRRQQQGGTRSVNQSTVSSYPEYSRSSSNLQAGFADHRHLQLPTAINTRESINGGSSNNDSPLPLESKPIMEGWLTKRGLVNNLWRLRYFRLSESNMLYYEAKHRDGLIIDESGEIRCWVNKRVSIGATEHTLAPHVNHLQHILKQPDRCQVFLKFCQERLSAENVEFYIAVENFKQLPDHSIIQNQTAKDIMYDFIQANAEKDISAPAEVRESMEMSLQQDQLQITPNMFNNLQKLVLCHMEATLLPQYLDHSRNKAKEYENFTIKTDFTESDKKIASCYNCLRAFSGFTHGKRRNFCRFCGDIFCNDCVSKKCHLPEEYGVVEPVNVCDMCHGVLTYGNHPHAFSYVSRGHRPMNFAADNADDMQRWINAFKQCLAQKQQNINGINTSSAIQSNNNNIIDDSPRSTTSSTSWSSAKASVINNINNLSSAGTGSATNSLVQPRVRLEGWLNKEDSSKMWCRRYIVLDNGHLHEYELALKGFIPLAEGAGVHAQNEAKPTLTAHDRGIVRGLQPATDFAYRFHLSYKTRLYALGADSGEDMRRWIEAIHRAVGKGRPDRDRRPQLREQYSEAINQEAPVGEVTFVFTDVQNSTKLWEAVPQSMNKSLEKHDNLLRVLLKQFRGYEVKTEGDAFMVTFFSAIDAILWCLAVQHALLSENWPDELTSLPSAAKIHSDDGILLFDGIRIRMGIHIGTPSCRRNPVTGRMDYYGQVVNRSARVADSAHGGQIICTEEVHNRLMTAIAANEFQKHILIDDLGYYQYKGINDPVRIYMINAPDLFARKNHFPPLRVKEYKETEMLKTNDTSVKAHRSDTIDTNIGSSIIPTRHDSHHDPISSNSDSSTSNIGVDEIMSIPLRHLTISSRADSVTVSRHIPFISGVPEESNPSPQSLNIPLYPAPEISSTPSVEDSDCPPLSPRYREFKSATAAPAPSSPNTQSPNGTNTTESSSSVVRRLIASFTNLSSRSPKDFELNGKNSSRPNSARNITPHSSTPSNTAVTKSRPLSPKSGRTKT